jgi:hypothetical protein
LELQVVYSTLYQRVPTLALAEPVDELDFKHELAVYGLNIFYTRKESPDDDDRAAGLYPRTGVTPR